MARLIAVEWDAREARVVVARQRGKELVFEHAFPVELVPADPGQTFNNADAGERVGAALAARGIGRSDALVALGRTHTELRQLSLPPCPLEELPDLVRFQAMRQFASIGEGWPLDYAHIDTGQTDEFHVLAAAISPVLIDQIHKTCELAGLTVKHLVLRPFAAASLFRRYDRNHTDHCRLIVDPLGIEADLTVMIDEQVGFMRTVRMGEGEQASAGLVGEIRRTIVAAQNQLNGQRVERIVLCGDMEDHTALKQQLEESLSIPVDVFDPFDGLRLEGDLAKSLPPHHGRFLPLLGMLLDEAEGARHAIDFLNPTKRPAPPSNSRRNILVGATAATLLFALVGGFWWQLSSLDRRANNLQVETNQLEPTLKTATKRRADVAAIDEFLAGDVTWLDELRTLSLAMPSAEKAIVTQMVASERPKGGGHIRLSGAVATAPMLDDLQRQLRDERHSVIGSGVQFDQSRANYPWRFSEENVVIEPEDHSRRFDTGGGAEGSSEGDEPEATPPKELTTVETKPPASHEERDTVETTHEKVLTSSEATHGLGLTRDDDAPERTSNEGDAV